MSHLSAEEEKAWRKEMTAALKDWLAAGLLGDCSIEALAESLGLFHGTMVHLENADTWSFAYIFHVANRLGYKFLMVQK